MHDRTRERGGRGREDVRIATCLRVEVVQLSKVRMGGDKSARVSSIHTRHQLRLGG